MVLTYTPSDPNNPWPAIGTLAHAPIDGTIAVYLNGTRAYSWYFEVRGIMLKVLAWAPGSILCVDYRY
jgi:hypothetical protein